MRRIFLPIVLVWRDKTIDVKGEAALVVPALYIRKGRTLTINGVDPTKRFEFRIGPGPMIVKGDIRLAKKPTEISVEDLRKLQVKDENES